MEVSVREKQCCEECYIAEDKNLELRVLGEVSRETRRCLNTEKQMKWYQNKGVMALVILMAA